MGVKGIGGLFFRAHEPEALSAWYRDQLQIGAGCNSTGEDALNEWFWQAEGGPVVFAPFKAATDYWSADKQFMLNLRVSDLPSLIARLEANGVAVETRAEWDSPETGRFARIQDPEENPIELWEPPAGP